MHRRRPLFPFIASDPSYMRKDDAVSVYGISILLAWANESGKRFDHATSFPHHERLFCSSAAASMAFCRASSTLRLSKYSTQLLAQLPSYPFRSFEHVFPFSLPGARISDLSRHAK